MVTLQRDTKTEPERYSGYASSFREANGRGYTRTNDDAIYYDRTSTLRRPEAPSYTIRRNEELEDDYTATEQRRIDSMRLPKFKVYNEEDMHTYTNVRPKQKKAVRLNTGSKIILSAYIVLVVLIATLAIVSTGFANTTKPNVGSQLNANDGEYAASSIIYAESTNWFDRFCDFLSEVTGG